MTDEEITKYIFIEDTDVAGDIAFVFGTWKDWNKSVKVATQLYKDGLVPKIIFSGGVNKDTGVIEGEAMAQEAVELGVPKKDILVENKSTNTLENVTFSLEIINKELELGNIKTITAVVKNYHSRRALMTLRRQVPSKVILKAATYTPENNSFTKKNWMNYDFGKEKVFGEMQKIKTYLTKGDLEELK